MKKFLFFNIVLILVGDLVFGQSSKVKFGINIASILNSNKTIQSFSSLNNTPLTINQSMGFGLGIQGEKSILTDEMYGELNLSFSHENLPFWKEFKSTNTTTLFPSKLNASISNVNIEGKLKLDIGQLINSGNVYKVSVGYFFNKDIYSAKSVTLNSKVASFVSNANLSRTKEIYYWGYSLGFEFGSKNIKLKDLDFGIFYYQSFTVKNNIFQFTYLDANSISNQNLITLKPNSIKFRVAYYLFRS